MAAEDDAAPDPDVHGAPGPEVAEPNDEAVLEDQNLEELSDDVLAPDEIQQFEADLASLQRERDEWLDTTRRLQADFENYRKRVVREQTALVERASEGLIEQLLPVLDNFELALRSIGEEHEQVRKGVELVYAELLSVLEREGLERIEAVGAPFDPNEHEAVMQEDGDGDGEPVVGDVFRTGWKLKGRVLRPSMVKVTTGQTEA
jgi:molecular chaperone GrpE